jgi:hypothetical protein
MREAAFEHASIAAFARTSLELLAHGAPPELVAGAHAAALDEVEHARIAYALASRYARKPVGPGALPDATRAMTQRGLAELAVETLVDGCAGEAAAALVLREAARRAKSGELAGQLDGMAEDEERHAELAWRTLAWALREGGAEVISRVQAEADELRRASLTRVPTDGADLDLSAHGIVDLATQSHIRARSVIEVVLPCLDALLDVCRLSGVTRS